MLSRTPLAACVMVALSISALLAQDKPALKSDSGSSLPGAVERPPLESPSPDKKLSPPPVMRVCANPADWSQCSTWTWVNGHYDGWREWGANATMTVESFTRASVIVHRSDTGPKGPGHPGAGFTMVYKGTISAAGDSILDGFSVGNDGRTSPFRAYWGRALQDSSARTPQGAPSRPQQQAPIMPQMSEPTAAMATIRLDMNGDWEGYYDGPAFVKAIRITQNGNDITAEDLFVDQLTPVGKTFFRGTYGSPASHFEVRLAVYQGLFGLLGQPQSWEAGQVTIGDPDHFRIGNHPPFVRLKSPKRGDVPCDSSNRFHTTGKGAFVRGNLQLQVNNNQEAFCWYYVGSNQGDREALSQLGYMYHHGLGVREDDGMALKLFMASADEGSIAGTHNVSVMYELGHGVAKDPAKAEFWRSKEEKLRAERKAQSKAEELADDQRKQAMEVIAMLGRVAVSTIAQAGLESPLCDWNTATNSQRDIEHKKDVLKGEGMICKDGQLRSAGK